MKNIKKIICAGCCIVLGVLVTAGAVNMQTKQEEPSSKTVIDRENNSTVYTIRSESSLATDISDPSKMADMSQYVAIVRVDSVDGVSNYSDVSQEYVSAYTYGSLTVLENIKGNLPVNEKLEFYRLGGAISVDEYVKSLSDMEKMQYERAKENDGSLAMADYIEVLNTDDIRIESGKTYLVYMIDEAAYKNKPDTYAIIGFKGGLREVQAKVKTDDIQTFYNSSVKILNNFTGEWEGLDSVVE